MGARGPKKQPTALRLMRGDPSKEGKKKAEPKPPSMDGVPKSVQNDLLALEVWREVVPALAAVGIATKIDNATLARYCLLSADFQRYTEICSKGGDIMMTKTGYTQQTPEATLRLKIASMLLGMEREFGMTASSRAGLSVQDKPTDDLTDFLKEA